ncbi:hypothetical protein KP79_PYT09798 [Mizuhopecten yessoensis]|uniref:G-protein coupled receptors family 1 profile domain-containing protein n=1 Tax=Mizuhopecten yessoensis TaxID=6573 RepID=A0A210PKU2_MIZYE|nr:hypothetical protein KP79_PYT09798 [Mizuhopecten yessoensis]
MAYGNGYDIPVYGLDNGGFHLLHILAICCIFLSLISALSIVVVSFKQNSEKSFFSWTKSERLVVYLALCDGCFNISHSLDHFNILLTKDHVRPLELCQFYSFINLEFIFAQTLMVNVIAINAFLMIYFGKNLDFGKKDWRLLVWGFVTPLVLDIVCAATGQFGPTGAYCFFDGIKAKISNICLTTIPMSLILVANAILYGLTFYRIQSEAKRLQHSLGSSSNASRASHRAARNMILFLFAFFVQWWAATVFGIWLLFEEPPMTFFQMVTTFSNIGGVLNGITYAIIRRRQTSVKPESKGNTQHAASSS